MTKADSFTSATYNYDGSGLVNKPTITYEPGTSYSTVLLGEFLVEREVNAE